ncbi:Scr1 family TA system antitoxin-like transcriptional regulator [Streptomyces sp. NPDC059063]|uniref:helix-turn-helix domain-containing protein n=1 Tax=unclassified Streptomyces TaxID=2593676 RepID=UPI00368A0928
MAHNVGWEQGEPESSDSMRTFGGFVQGLREHAGLSREEFGALVHLSKHSVESIELGRRLADQDFVEEAEAALGNTGALRKAYRRVGRERGLAAWFRQWARLEQVAALLYTYECRLVPGLLQSEAYARLAFANSIPLLTEDQIEVQVAARMERQHMFRERPDVPFAFIIEEHIFRRHLGSTEVTKEAIDHVLNHAKLRNVTVQLMPVSCAQHACLDGSLQLLETPDGRRLAYSEGQKNGRLISGLKEVTVLRQRYDTLRSQALTPLDSLGLLEQIRGAL